MMHQLIHAEFDRFSLRNGGEHDIDKAEKFKSWLHEIGGLAKRD